MRMGHYGKRLVSGLLAMAMLGSSSYALAAPAGSVYLPETIALYAEDGETIEQIRAAAEQGDAKAQNRLGTCYYYGHGVDQDYKQAAEWYQKAAEQGHAEAQNNLATCYYYQRGLPKSYEQAAEWNRKSAEQGYAQAQYDLAVCYFNGDGVDQDYKQAAEWYRKAAEQGYAEAQYNLGLCYDNGWGVQQDHKQAVEWYQKAAARGHEKAKEALARESIIPNPFTDVADSSPYAKGIAWAVERNITKGTTATTFGPSNTCTTSHILTFLYRTAGSPNAGSDERAAVTAWANGLGIDTSNLSASCTRAAAVTYIWKSAGSPAPTKTASFSDVSAGADYAQAISWAVEKGITNGTSATTFAPDSTCTRGQIVTFLYRHLA